MQLLALIFERKNISNIYHNLGGINQLSVPYMNENTHLINNHGTYTLFIHQLVEINTEKGTFWGSVATLMTCAIGSGVLALRTYFDR